MQLYREIFFAINVVYNLMHHDCTKHVERDSHFIKEKLETNLICIHFNV